MRFAVALMILGLALTAPVSATVVVQQDLGTLLDSSDAVLVLSVEDVRSVPVRDGSFAFTFVTFRVEEKLKGSAAGAFLTLRFPGGEVGPETFEVEGTPQFAPGGRHLLFVRQGSLMPVVGWGQGKLDLVRHPRSGEEILIDHQGAIVSGVAGRSWKLGGGSVTPEGLFRESSSRPAAAILAEQGVKITLPETASASDTGPVPSRNVLRAVRRMAGERSKLPTYRAPRIVESDSLLEVPERFQFRAYRTPTPEPAGKEQQP